MGRHNRRRSRPRGRGQNKVDSRPDIYEARAILSDVDFAVGILPGQYQMNQMWRQRLAEERQLEVERLAEEQRRIFGGEIGDERWQGGEAYVSHDCQDLVRLGLLYGTPQDHDRHDAISTGDEERREAPAPTFRTRSFSSSDKRTRSPSALPVDGDFSSSEEEWDIMSSTGSETNQSEAWEFVGDDV